MASKHEKKLMEERIGKVREVVHNVSTNDIILALHNFDMNIEKTIHAFCEGGFQAALGDWEKTGTSIKKKSGKKAVTSSNPSGKSNSTASSINQGSKMSQLATSSISSSLSSIGFAVNGYVPQSSSPTPQRTIDKPAMNGISAFDPASNSGATNHVRAIEFATTNLTNQNGHSQAHKPTMPIPLKPSIDEYSPEEYLSYCFKEIRDALAVREQQLLDELSRATSAQIVCDTSDVVASIGRMGKVTSTKRKDLPPQDFAAPKPSVTPTAPPPIIQQNEVKRPNSPPSSQVSSIGEDSGLGQISPVHQAKPTTVVQVKENGIEMESDALSADQLAELQRNIHEQLKAKGIDPSVFMEIGAGLSGGSAPRNRRPPPPKHGGKQNGHSAPQQQGGRRNDNEQRPPRTTGDGKQSGGGGKAKEPSKKRPPVELSIMQ